MKYPIGLCVIAIFVTHYAHAEVWFRDDFESNSTVSTVAYPTTIPPAPTGDFDPDAPAVGTWRIQEDYPELGQVSSFTGSNQPLAAHSGNNYLVAGYNCDLPGACGTNRGLAWADLTASVGQATLDFWLWSQQWAENSQIDVIQARQLGAGGGIAFEMSFFNRASGLNLIKWDSSGGNNGIHLNAQLISDAWNHIVVKYDGVAGFADITINDEPTETFEARPEPFPRTFNSVVFRPENHGYFDDILVHDGNLSIEGDFDLDGDVDGRDFLVWQRGESPNPLSASDLADWQANYGPGSLVAAVRVVPEPTAAVLLISIVGTALAMTRFR